MRKEIIFILVSTCVLVLAWIAFGVYHNYKTSTIPEKLNIQIRTIIPKFDISTIEAIKNRSKASPIFELPPSDQTRTSGGSTGSARITPTPTINLQSPLGSSSGSSTESAEEETLP